MSVIGSTLQLGPTIYVSAVAGSALTVPANLTIGTTQFNVSPALTTAGVLYWSSGTVSTRPLPSVLTFIPAIDIINKYQGIGTYTYARGVSSISVFTSTSSAAISGFPADIRTVMVAGTYIIPNSSIILTVLSEADSTPLSYDIINTTSNIGAFNFMLPLSGAIGYNFRTFTLRLSTNMTSGTGTLTLSAIAVTY